MNLEKFPHDSQQCQLALESCGYSTNEVRVRWMKWFPITIANEVNANFMDRRLTIIYYNMKKLAIFSFN